MYLRVSSGILLLMVIAFSYFSIKNQLEKAGIVGIRCSVGLLFLWFLVPFFNLIMPWRACGALDRAAKFAARHGRSGDLWNQKGFRKISVRSVNMGVIFVVIGGYSIFYNKKLEQLAEAAPTDFYSFSKIIREQNDFLIVLIFLFSVYFVVIWVYFFFLNRYVLAIRFRIEHEVPNIQHCAGADAPDQST